MNDRQIALHEFLLAHPFEYTKRVDILCALKKWYYEESMTELDIRLLDLNMDSAGRLIKSDINKLRYEKTKVIISNTRKGYKVATKEEYLEYHKNKRAEIARECMLLNTQSRNYGLHNQLTLNGDIIESVVE